MDFNSLGLAPRLVSALSEAGITDPTPIQEGAIPHALAGRDVMGLAQTGSGKTAAFGLPMLDLLLKQGEKAQAKCARALVLAPTRELARQIHDALEVFARGSHLRLALVTGGLGFTPQIERMARGVAILVATPGRLIDLLDRRAVDLSRTRFLVLDEADQMLDMGFIHSLRRIAPLLPKERQTMLFSATMPRDMEEIAAAYLRDPVRVQVNPPGQAVDRIRQSLHFVARAAKAEVLVELLGGHRDELALVFGRTKHGSDKLFRHLEAKGFAAAALHGNKSQGARDRAVAAARAGEIRVLVATDVAARGLDIPEVRHVYNFDLPDVPEVYVHRIGRTARAGADGSAVALVAPDEMLLLKDVERAMKARIPVASGAPWEGPETLTRPARGGGGGGGRGQGSRDQGGGRAKAPHGGAQPRREGQGRAQGPGRVGGPAPARPHGPGKPGAPAGGRPGAGGQGHRGQGPRGQGSRGQGHGSQGGRRGGAG